MRDITQYNDRELYLWCNTEEDDYFIVNAHINYRQYGFLTNHLASRYKFTPKQFTYLIDNWEVSL